MIKVIDIECKDCGWVGEILEVHGEGECPNCGSHEYEVKLSAPHVNTRGCANAGGEVR